MLTWTRCLVLLWLVSVPVLTWQRVHVWQSEKALWAEALRASPLKPRPWINYGRTVELAGDLDGAERAYREAISLSFDPRRHPLQQRFAMVAAETNIAHVYMKRGLNASAMRILDQVLATWPNFPYAQINRAALLSSVGACQEAAKAIAMARWALIPVPDLSGCQEAEGQ
jgi:tetratricopeptide (TPR) repeat protein